LSATHHRCKLCAKPLCTAHSWHLRWYEASIRKINLIFFTITTFCTLCFIWIIFIHWKWSNSVSVIYEITYNLLNFEVWRSPKFDSGLSCHLKQFCFRLLWAIIWAIETTIML